LPLREGRLALALRPRVETVKIIGYWLAFPAHTNYLVVETDDIGHLHNFLLPGAGRTVAEITPVSDKPMPPPAETAA